MRTSKWAHPLLLIALVLSASFPVKGQDIKEIVDWTELQNDVALRWTSP